MMGIQTGDLTTSHADSNLLEKTSILSRIHQLLLV